MTYLSSRKSCRVSAAAAGVQQKRKPTQHAVSAPFLSQQRLALLGFRVHRGITGTAAAARLVVPGHLLHYGPVERLLVVIGRGNVQGRATAVGGEGAGASPLGATSDAVAAAAQHAVPRGLLGELLGADKELLEGLTKLPRHAAVDGEVDAVGEGDAEIAERDEDGEDGLGDHGEFPGVLHDEDEQHTRQRQLHGQENKHHRHEPGWMYAQTNAFKCRVITINVYVSILHGKTSH